jgi:HD superfamily phosphohydrolase YqeK
MIQSKYFMTLEATSLQEQIQTYFEGFSRSDVYEHTCEVIEVYDKLTNFIDIPESIKKKGKVAVMLHDVGRVVDHLDIVKFCEENGKIATESELKAVGILHQYASKFIAMTVFGIDDKTVLNAIECHTTLKGNPGIVDKLVFLADKMSWKEADSVDLIRKMNDHLSTSIDLALYEYHKAMYKNRKAMLCYHEWSNEAYHYLIKVVSNE